MARMPQDREDLLRDATAFVNRVQFRVPTGDGAVTTFAGFRSNGAASFYFDQDPVYHFNTSGELRRAFVGGSLLKAEHGVLVRWHRQQGDSEIAMVRHELSGSEQQSLVTMIRQQLDELHTALLASHYTIDGQVIDEQGSHPLSLVIMFLKQLGGLRIAKSTRVTG